MTDRGAIRPHARIDLRAHLPVLAVLIVAAVLRLPGIASRALWIDEAFCVRLAQLDWTQLAERAAADNHPPLYFAVLKLWMAVFGSSALALRSLDLVLGVATVALVYALARRVLGSRGWALAAAAWLALQPAHVLWAAQVRMYALAGFLAVLSGLLLLDALRDPSWRRWAAWTAAAIALVYTHYFGAFVVLAQGLHAVVTLARAPERRGLVRALVAGAAVGVAFAPWLGVVAAQSERVAALWWVPPLTPSRLLWAWSRTAGLMIEDEFTVPGGVAAWAIGTLALLVAAAVVRAALQRDRGIRLCAWCTLLPVLAGVAVTLALGKNVVLARYLIVAQVFLPIAVAGAVRSRLALVPVAVALVLALVAELPVLVPAPDVPVAAAWIDAQRRPGDRVTVEQFYYWSFRIRRDPGLVMLTPRPQPIQVLGAALIGPDDVVLAPADLARQHGRLFVVDSAFAHAPVPPAWRRLAWARFPVAIPSDPKFALQVTLYAAP